MTANQDSWNKKHIYKVRDNREPILIDEKPNPENLQKIIEPWLTALFQSEHLSLVLGAGISTATHFLAKKQSGAGMNTMKFSVFNEQVEIASKKSAENSGRGSANIEDQIRVCNELIKGLEIYICNNLYGSKKIGKTLNQFKEELRKGLNDFANIVLNCERNIIKTPHSEQAAEYLMSFLISFANRSATRERLNIFSTNYDRIIEYGAELAGIRLIDRFIGNINPIFRSSRINIDMHYNPPGIRGEPRYLEGIAQFTKLHGSLDWVQQNDVVRRIALPYGAENLNNYIDNSESLLIYPNAAKDRETSEYPYVELFRDLAASVCRPNSTVFVYGYSFGDEHINRVIADMLTIPSTHLVIISFDDQGDRIKRFYNKVKRPLQISLLIGNHFGDLKMLVDHYLPKPAIDRTSIKMTELLKARGLDTPLIPDTIENGEQG
ncbi:TPA: hypothetical protein JBI05_01005 [Legionella pneumophila]|nr:hypothetical protein [Legionella pneumophila]